MGTLAFFVKTYLLREPTGSWELRLFSFSFYIFIVVLIIISEGKNPEILLQFEGSHWLGWVGALLKK